MNKYLKLFAGLSFLILTLTSCSGESNNSSTHEHTWGSPTYTWTSDYSSCTAERVCSGDASHKETETKASVYTVQTPAGCETEGQGRYTVTFENIAFETQIHDVVLNPINHNWGTPTYEWSADYSQCTATRVCLNDSNHIETETVNSTYIVVTESSCETDGLGRYAVSFENSAFTMQTHNTVIEAKGHDYRFDSFVWEGFTAQAKYICSHDSSHIEYHNATVTSEVTTAPLCENSGVRTYTATYDGHSDTKIEVLSELGHDYQFDSFVWTDFTAQAKYICSHDNSHIEYHDATVTSEVTIAPLCESSGVRTYTATYDGHSDTKTEVLSELGHDWGEPTYTWSENYSSCTAERICLNDSSHKETETINSTYEVITPATCDADGLGRHTATFTKSAFAKQTHDSIIEAEGHDYQFDSFVWEGFTAQAKYACSHDSSHVEYHNATVTSEVTTAPLCENSGVRTYTATYDGHSDTKTEVLSAIGHDWGETTYVWAEDNSTVTATRVCSNDNTHVETETVNTSYILVTETTCEYDGSGTYAATFENEAFETQIKEVTITANGHVWGEPTYEWAEDNSTVTATRVCLNDSTHIDTETANSSYEVITDSTEEIEGLGRYTVTFTKEYFITQTKDVEIPKKEPSPVIDLENMTVTYGIYPQTVLEDKDGIYDALNSLTTPESNGWYLYNNEYYAKLKANPVQTNYTFDNGETIEKYNTYWFKCEPITWNILSNNDGKYYLLSSVLLDHHYYNTSSSRTIDGETIYQNNYEYSDIRAWLNDDFYNSAFSLGNSYIQTTTVDNSASTTSNGENSYICDNTNDKVFLPSYQDYINSSYGFSTSIDSTTTRECKTTDWARASGAWYSPIIPYNGAYYTRSPSSDSNMYAWTILPDGTLDGSLIVYNSNRGVRPALTIKIA